MARTIPETPRTDAPGDNELIAYFTPSTDAPKSGTVGRLLLRMYDWVAGQLDPESNDNVGFWAAPDSTIETGVVKLVASFAGDVPTYLQEPAANMPLSALPVGIAIATNLYAPGQFNVGTGRAQTVFSVGDTFYLHPDEPYSRRWLRFVVTQVISLTGATLYKATVTQGTGDASFRTSIGEVYRVTSRIPRDPWRFSSSEISDPANLQQGNYHNRIPVVNVTTTLASDLTLVAAGGKLYRATGATVTSITLPGSATATDLGQKLWVQNSLTSGTLTVDAGTGATVDGGSSVMLRSGETRQFVSVTATEWRSTGSGGDIIAGEVVRSATTELTAPAGDDRLIVTDESVTGDPDRWMSLTRLFDWFRGLIAPLQTDDDFFWVAGTQIFGAPGSLVDIAIKYISAISGGNTTYIDPPTDIRAGLSTYSTPIAFEVTTNSQHSLSDGDDRAATVYNVTDVVYLFDSGRATPAATGWQATITARAAITNGYRYTATFSKYGVTGATLPTLREGVRISSRRPRNPLALSASEIANPAGLVRRTLAAAGVARNTELVIVGDRNLEAAAVSTLDGKVGLGVQDEGGTTVYPRTLNFTGTPVTVGSVDPNGVAEVAITATGGGGGTPVSTTTATVRGIQLGTQLDQNPYVVNPTNALQVAHGLGAVPDGVYAWIQCRTANRGYAVGDRVQIGNWWDLGLAADATNLTFYAGNPVGIQNKSADLRGGITAGSWSFHAVPWRYQTTTVVTGVTGGGGGGGSFDLQDDVTMQAAGGLANTDRFVVADQSVSGAPNRYVTSEQVFSNIYTQLVDFTEPDSTDDFFERQEGNVALVTGGIRLVSAFTGNTPTYVNGDDAINGGIGSLVPVGFAISNTASQAPPSVSTKTAQVYAQNAVITLSQAAPFDDRFFTCTITAAPTTVTGGRLYRATMVAGSGGNPPLNGILRLDSDEPRGSLHLAASEIADPGNLVRDGAVSNPSGSTALVAVNGHQLRDLTISALRGAALTITNTGAARTLTTSDYGTLLRLTGSTARTWTLPNITTAGVSFLVENASSANLTLDGDGTDTVDGGTTLILPPGAVAMLVATTTTAWRAWAKTPPISNPTSFQPGNGTFATIGEGYQNSDLLAISINGNTGALVFERTIIQTLSWFSTVRHVHFAGGGDTASVSIQRNTTQTGLEARRNAGLSSAFMNVWKIG